MLRRPHETAVGYCVRPHEGRLPTVGRRVGVRALIQGITWNEAVEAHEASRRVN